jgi:dipeptidase E
MKLLLTSTGLANIDIRNRFISLFNRDFSLVKVLFIVSAAEEPKEKWYVNKSRDELLELGIKKENFIVYHQGKKPDQKLLNSVSLIYVCGGNTFRLLKELKQNNLDKDIIEMIKGGIFYIGASAGSIIVTPSIRIVEPWDTNDQGLADLNALNLTDFTLIPHFTESDEQKVKDIEDRLGIEVKRISDEQAILVVDDNIKIIN